MTVVLRAHAGLDIVDDEFALPADHRQASRENTTERRRLLGEFIRSRRERTTPDMVGHATRPAPAHAGPASRGSRAAVGHRDHLVHLA